MRIRRAGIRAFRLPLVAPLATAHGSIAERRGFLIGLEDDAGRRGLGEATPLPEFGTEGLVACERALIAGLGRLLERSMEQDPADVFPERAPPRAGAPCARAALESCFEDLAARCTGVSVAARWRRRAGLQGAPADAVAVQALIGGDSPAAVVASATRARERGHQAFKLKLAVSPQRRSLGLDLERVAALRETVGEAPRIRLDANEAWTLAEAEAALGALARFDIDYVEQPVSRTDLESLSRLDRTAPIRVAADESLLGDGLARCLEQRAARILVLKPAALGGVGPSLEIVSRAREQGLRIVWSSLLDGAISRGVALHLAAAVGAPEEIQGLGTGPLLARDLPGGPRIEAGRLACSRSPGLGLEEAGRLAFEDADADARAPAMATELEPPLWLDRPRFLEPRR